MEEGQIYFLVLSDAGYGNSARGTFLSKDLAEQKGNRLLRKGHKSFEIQEVKLISVAKYPLED